jgi:hypothetical protein
MARRSSQGAHVRRARFIVRPLFAALVASGLAAPTGVPAATIPVTTGGDAGNGSTCTLRQAVDSINAGALVAGCTNPGAVMFGVGDTVDLTSQSGTIALAGASEIEIDVTMILNGPGAGVLTVSGAGASRVFANPPSGPSMVLDINGLTVANGKSAGPGGCIFGAGTVRLLDSVVTGCTALHSIDFPSNPATYLNGLGGGVAAYDVRLTNSTVTSNTAQTGGGGVFAKYTTLDHSRVSNNSVSGHTCNITVAQKYCATALLGGGGILTGEAQLVHSTVSGNTVHASTISSDNAGPPPVTTTFNIGLGGGISQLGKYQVEVVAASSAKSTVFGPHSAEARAARRAAAASATAKSRAGIAGSARSKADGYGDHILAMVASTVSGNTVTGNKLHDGKYAGGGAFAYSRYYNAEIANSTISGNTLDPGGEYLVGGGLFADSAEITTSTISGNNGLMAVAFKYSTNMLAPPTAKATKASPGARGADVAKARAFGASVRAKLAALRGAHGKAAVNKAASEPIMVSTIVGGNAAIYDVSCGSCTISGSNNLVQFPDAALPIDTIVGQDPRLTPLANHGGQNAGAAGHAQTAPVPTHLLFTGSPAINAGLNPENFSYEQRGAGFARVIGPAADIGATEGSVASDIPVPILGPWLVAALSALLGALGLATRRRRRTA